MCIITQPTFHNWQWRSNVRMDVSAQSTRHVSTLVYSDDVAVCKIVQVRVSSCIVKVAYDDCAKEADRVKVILHVIAQIAARAEEQM
jgi:hypothetical protein